MTTTKISLTEILELAGDIPAEGILTVLGQVAYKSKKGSIDLNASPQQVASLYQQFQSSEMVERTFSYLFAKTGDKNSAGDSYSKLILFLENRKAYGMAGDAAMEADIIFGGTDIFRIKAEKLYTLEIRKLDEERSRNGEVNESYYDEMLLKAGRRDDFRIRAESRLKSWLARGEWSVAAGICDKLGRSEEATRYRTLNEIIQ